MTEKNGGEKTDGEKTDGEKTQRGKDLPGKRPAGKDIAGKNGGEKTDGEKTDGEKTGGERQIVVKRSIQQILYLLYLNEILVHMLFSARASGSRKQAMRHNKHTGSGGPSAKKCNCYGILYNFHIRFLAIFNALCTVFNFH